MSDIMPIPCQMWGTCLLEVITMPKLDLDALFLCKFNMMLIYHGWNDIWSLFVILWMILMHYA